MVAGVTLFPSSVQDTVAQKLDADPSLRKQWEDVSVRFRYVFVDPEAAFRAMNFDAVLADGEAARALRGLRRNLAGDAGNQQRRRSRDQRIALDRQAGADHRGGGVRHVTLDTSIGDSVGAAADEVLDVHAALEELQGIDARLVRVVEMRYFVGMTDLEIADALGVTDRTVRRDWEKARLLLAHAMRP